MPGDDGVEESFTAFVRASGERHLRVAVLLTGDWHAAEDLVQASLVKLYRAWPGIDQADGDPDAYLRRIIVNTQRSWWRARWRREAPVAQLPEGQAGGEDADQRALAVSIRQALGRLSPRQRAVLVLRYYEDLPEAEIASLLGCSPGAVKTHAHRGLRALRGELSAFGDRWPPGGAQARPGATDRRAAESDLHGGAWPADSPPGAPAGPRAAGGGGPVFSHAATKTAATKTAGVGSDMR